MIMKARNGVANASQKHDRAIVKMLARLVTIMATSFLPRKRHYEEVS